MIPQLSFPLLMKALYNLNRDEQILPASEPKQSCLTALAHPRLIRWPLWARFITEDSQWSSHYHPSRLAHTHPQYEKQSSLHRAANTAHHILPPQLAPFSYHLKQWHSSSAQPDLHRAYPTDTAAEPAQTPPELTHPLPPHSPPHQLPFALYRLFTAGSITEIDRVLLVPCNTGWFLANARNPISSHAPAFCPGPLHLQAVHWCVLPNAFHLSLSNQWKSI